MARRSGLPSHVPAVIVGAGATGLFCAAELALAGTGCLLLEKAEGQSTQTRAMVLHARTLEYFDMRGIAEAFLREGYRYDRYPLGARRADVDLTRLPSRFACALGLPQYRTLAILAEHARSLGVACVYGAEVIDLVVEDTGATLKVAHRGLVHDVTADYVVACDGADSLVRSRAGFGFPGKRYTPFVISADAALVAPPSRQPWATFSSEGMAILLPIDDATWRIVMYDYRDRSFPDAGVDRDEHVRSAMKRICGSDFGFRGFIRTDFYRCEHHLATEYRRGRILLAGDAAHVHPPTGGKGLNTGIADAINLGWKLGRVIAGSAPDRVLDSYAEERRAVGIQVLRFTSGLLRFNTARSPGLRLLRKVALATALRTRPVQHFLATSISDIDASPHTSGKPFNVGGRMPDLGVRMEAGEEARLFEILRRGRFVLVRPSSASSWPLLKNRDSVIAVCAQRQGQDLDVPAVLVRPDGNVAWTGRAQGPDIFAALRAWGLES